MLLARLAFGANAEAEAEADAELVVAGMKSSLLRLGALSCGGGGPSELVAAICWLELKTKAIRTAIDIIADSDNIERQLVALNAHWLRLANLLASGQAADAAAPLSLSAAPTTWGASISLPANPLEAELLSSLWLAHYWTLVGQHIALRRDLLASLPFEFDFYLAQHFNFYSSSSCRSVAGFIWSPCSERIFLLACRASFVLSSCLVSL